MLSVIAGKPIFSTINPCLLQFLGVAHLAVIFNPHPEATNVHLIRELSAPELSRFESLFAEFQTLLKRQSLVHILDKSFRDLDELVTSFEKSDNGRSATLAIDLNKCFMDYLSAGYALREHLKTLLKRDFGRDSEHVVRFPQVLWYLEKTCFEYAFLQDFRNFVQHCTFPIENLKLARGQKGSVLIVSYTRTNLLKYYNGWKKSALDKRTENEIDLVSTVRIAHRETIQKFSGIVCLAYGKNLTKMDECFSSYQKEAATISPKSTAQIVLSIAGDSSHGKVRLQDIPRNVYHLLGLKRPSPGVER